MRAFSEYGARPVLREPLAVPVNPDDPVKNQVDAGARLSLADKHLPRLDLAEAWLGRPLHQLHRQRPFQRRLHGGDQRGRILISPGAVPAERLAVPVTEVGQAGLVRDVAVGVVDPVPGEPARPGERELGPARNTLANRNRLAARSLSMSPSSPGGGSS